MNSFDSNNAGLPAGGGALQSPALRSGDRAFLDECRRHLNSTLVSMAADLVHALRRAHSGDLIEGQARKWVNRPSNFVALTIQSRDQSLAISVKGRPSEYVAPALDIKCGWGTYSVFKLQSEIQLLDAIKVILASAARRRR